MLSLKVLGSFQALLDGAPITGFNSDKTRALLAFLAIESDRTHRRESLAALLWPDVAEVSARQSLSQALSNLRKVLKDADAARPFILADRDSVQFNRDADYTLDVERLKFGTEPDGQYPIPVFRPLLEGFTFPDADGFEEWLTLQREMLQRAALDQLDKAIASALRDGDADWAIEAARRQIEIDPWREESHRYLMLAYARSGQRSAALAQYDKCRQVLRDALGVEPAAETRQLYEQIKTGEMGSVSINTPVPAPPASSRRIHILPRAATVFIGRREELRVLGDLLADPATRLITLLGLGGMGKTRLAIEAAAEAEAHFADGIAFVALAAARDAEQAAQVIAATLKIELDQQAGTASQLARHLAERQLLLVLDNAEQLLDGADFAEFTLALLTAAPRTKLLVTSRQELQLQAETVFRLEGMAGEAQALFLQSARRSRASFRATAQDEQAIARICQLTGGMPLGIELAASWLNVMSPAEIADEIERGVDILAASFRDMPERHHSIMAVFDATWRLLPESEQHVLEALSVFRGGFTRELARQVTSVSLAALSQLVSKSLLRRAESNRYDLHELLRQYARGRLTQRGAETEARRRHALAYLTYVEANERTFYGPQANRFVAELAPEQSNFRTALEWSSDPNGDATMAMRLAAGLVRYYYMLPNWQEGEHWLRVALARVNEVADARLIARSHMGLGMLEHALGRYDAALQQFERALATFEQLNDTWHTAWTLCQMYQCHYAEGRIEPSKALARRSLDLFRALNDEWATAYVTWQLGHVARAQNDYALASALAGESLALFERLNDPGCIVLATNLLGQIATLQGDLPQARAYFANGLRISESAGIAAGIAWTTQELGEVALMQRDGAEAVKLLTMALKRRRDIGDTIAAFECVQGMAIGMAQAGEYVQSARLLGMASVGPRGEGFLMKPWLQPLHDEAMATVTDGLGQAQWSAEWQAGKLMPLDAMTASQPAPA